MGFNAPTTSTSKSTKGKPMTGNGSATPAAVSLKDLQEQLAREVARRETAELEAAALREQAAAASQPRTITCKIGPKGGMVIRGFGRYPIMNAYLAQFERFANEAMPLAIAFAEKYAAAGYFKLDTETADQYEARRASMPTGDKAIFSQPRGQDEE